MANCHDVTLDTLSLFSNLPWIVSKAMMCLWIPRGYVDKYAKFVACDYDVSL